MFEFFKDLFSPKQPQKPIMVNVRKAKVIIHIDYILGPADSIREYEFCGDIFSDINGEALHYPRPRYAKEKVNQFLKELNFKGFLEIDENIFVPLNRITRINVEYEDLILEF